MGRSEPLEIPRPSGDINCARWCRLRTARSTRWNSAANFPWRFALSPQCIVWDLAEVQAWLISPARKASLRAKHPDVA